MSTKSLIVKPTNDQLLARRRKLDDIIHSHAQDPEKPKDKELIKEMQAHYEGYDRHHLHKDRLYIMASDNFVSEMSMFRYSATMRDIFSKIDLVQERAIKEFDNEKGFVKINSMKLVLEANKLKNDILEGKAMDTSIELLGKQLRKLTEENDKLTNQLT